MTVEPGFRATAGGPAGLGRVRPDPARTQYESGSPEALNLTGQELKSVGEVVLVEGVRTAIGRFGGSLKDVPASDLAAAAIREVLRRTDVPHELIGDVIFGCVGQVGEDAYIARTSAMKAGLPKETPAFTVNRLCSSGLQSIVSAGHAIRLGEAEAVIAGAPNPCPTRPYFLRRARWGYRMGHDSVEDGLLTMLNDPFKKYHMGVTAENVAEKWGISRERQDEVAYQSQMRMARAMEAGYFDGQIVPITVKDGREERVFDADEHRGRTRHWSVWRR